MEALNAEYEDILKLNLDHLITLRNFLVFSDKYNIIMKEVPLSLYQTVNKSLYITSRSIGIVVSGVESKSVLLYTTSIISYLVIRKLIRSELRKHNFHESRDKEFHQTQKRFI